MSIRENILALKSTLPENVKLVAVSKTKPVSDILLAYEAGQRSFGENRTTEMAAKFPQVPSDTEWHFIGHLQTNKVKVIAPFVSCIHSVDSLKLLTEIDREARKNDRIINCLLQFHIAEEETKSGLTEDVAEEMAGSDIWRRLQHVRVTGVMGMATFTDDKEQVRNEFRHLKEIFSRLKSKYFADESSFCEISMGMSDDYRIAVEEGSTIVRIGNAVFGARNPQ